MQNKPSIHVVLAGGGTGGHVFPGLAVAQELRKRGHRVTWIGRPVGMEKGLVEQAGVEFRALPARPWVGQGLVAKVSALATLGLSGLRARSMIRSLGANVVLATGGYVSVPAVLGARLRRCPTYLFEPNAKAGAANRRLSRWCRGAFVAYDETSKELDCPAQRVGIPVRSSFHRVSELPSGAPHLLILGGSQGARQLNELLPETVSALRRVLPQVSVTHQTGTRHFEVVKRTYEGLALDSGVELVPFIDDVASAMTAAHLVVSRAGALATAELAAAGRPSVLVPLLAAGAGHQRFNAEVMAKSGGAVALEGDGLTSKALVDCLADLLSDRPRLEVMSRAARSLARPDSIGRIIETLEKAGGLA